MEIVVYENLYLLYTTEILVCYSLEILIQREVFGYHKKSNSLRKLHYLKTEIQLE